MSEIRQRTKLLAVRMTPDEHQALTAAAAAQGVSIGRFMRDAALLQAEHGQDRP